MRKIKTGFSTPNSKLVKIGTLAAMFNILPSTINFYTAEGFLRADGRTRGGYRLYDPDKAIATLKKIESLQNKKRFSLKEIKKLI